MDLGGAVMMGMSDIASLHVADMMDMSNWPTMGMNSAIALVETAPSSSIWAGADRALEAFEAANVLLRIERVSLR